MKQRTVKWQYIYKSLFTITERKHLAKHWTRKLGDILPNINRFFFIRPTFITDHLCGNLECTEKHPTNFFLSENVHKLPGAETFASNSCVDVVEAVVANCSPLVVVVDLQTTFVWQIAACQSHCSKPQNTE